MGAKKRPSLSGIVTRILTLVVGVISLKSDICEMDTPGFKKRDTNSMEPTAVEPAYIEWVSPPPPPIR